jgi:hypothetical protein
MKKIVLKIFSLCILLLAIVMVGCVEEVTDEKVSVMAPTGTPTLGIAKALEEEFIDEKIVSGADLLIAEFTKGEYDIIVAPVNLGAKFYNENENFKYQLYETIVWGSYYLASTSEIESFESLEGKTITVFGKNSTPDVVFRTLVASKNMNVTIEYVDDVNTANQFLMSGKAEIIVSAEPSITKISGTKTIYTLDLQNEWMKLTGSIHLPQAGIFVNKERITNASVQKALEKMKESVLLATTNPAELVKSACAVDSSLAKIGEEILNQAISKCNLMIDENQKAAIEFYFSKVMELNLGATIGGKLPDENFYA